MKRKECYAKRILIGAMALCMALSPVTTYAAEGASSAATSSTEETTGTDFTNNNEKENTALEDSSSEASSEEFATSTVADAVDAGNGVVQINCVYTDDDGSSHIIKGATGFIVGAQGDNSKQYIITSKNGIVPDKTTRKNALKSFGIKDISDKLDDISYEVVVTVDMTVSCELYQQSDKLDMAVFTPSENLVNRKPLSIYTSDDGFTNDLPYNTTDYVHSIGYPDEINYDKNPQRYDKKDTIISSGKIVNIHSLDDVYVITHNAEVGQNNCGGPLVNENGDVIGMNVLKKDGQYSVAIDSTEIVNVLDSFGIAYNKLTPGTVKPEIEESTTGASVIYINNRTTGNVATDKYSNTILIILIAVIVLLLATMIAVVMILLGKKPAITEEEKKKRTEEKQRRAEEKAKKKAEKEAKKREKLLPERPFPKPDLSDTNENQSGGTGMETGSLSHSSDEGTALLAEGPVITKSTNGSFNGGTLIRKKTGDNILLCKEETTIGKDSLHVDYCIRDNSAISRIHAAFTVNSQGVCVEDKNSTNGTFVNGTKLGEGETKLLNKGDVIRLANEEFEYRK